MLSVQEILCSTPDQTSRRVKGAVLFVLCFFFGGGWGVPGGLLCEKVGDTEKFKYTSRGCHHFGNNRAFALAKV